MTWSLDREGYRLVGPAGTVNLTRREFDLVTYMAKRPGVVRTRAELIDAVYGNTAVFDRTLDSILKRLRDKVMTVGPDPIETRRGIGYTWRDRLAG